MKEVFLRGAQSSTELGAFRVQGIFLAGVYRRFVGDVCV